MSAIPAKENKIVQFRIIEGGKKSEQKRVVDNIDYGSDNVHSLNKKKGVSSEVYAFRTDEEIKAMLDVFDKHIEESDTNEKEKIAKRNKLLFLIGINIGVRASDLRMLKWSYFFEEDNAGCRSFKTHYSFCPKKTKKSSKFVTLKFNNTIKMVVENFVNEYPVYDLDTYVFTSRKTTGRKKKNDNDVADSKGCMPISEISIGRIVKDAAKEAGIKQNICSHSLRKTWGYHAWHESDNKDERLVMLMRAFGHSSTHVTMKYIGIMQDDIDMIYEDTELGYEFL